MPRAAGFYDRPYPDEAAADLHAARTRVRSILTLLRAEVEWPEKSLAEVLLFVDEAAGWVRRVRGAGNAALLGGLQALKSEFQRAYGILPASYTLHCQVRADLFTALARCDRALEVWAAGVEGRE